MGLDRLGTDAEGDGHLIIGAAVGDEPDDIELARCEPRHGSSRTPSEGKPARRRATP